MDRFSRSWEITKHTFTVMRHDKEILLLPVFTIIFSTILFLLFLFPIFLGSVAEATTLIYIAVFGLYFTITFVATYFNAAIVYIAKTRFTGGNATLGDGLLAAGRHIKQIFAWSLLAATVGLILNILESKARENGNIIARIVISLIGMAWGIVSLFVVPSIVLEGYGPIEALKKSVATVKKTWGESLIKYVGISMVRTLFLFLGIVLFFVPAIFLFLNAFLLAASIVAALGVLYILIISIIFSAANTVFDTALFLYAHSGKIPTSYSQEEMKCVFRGKK